MARRRCEKYIELSAYELCYNEKNLFDDEYGNFQRQSGLIYEEISNLKNKNFINSLKIGRNILELFNGDITYNNLDRIIKHPLVQIGRTQAIKYIEAYNYLNEKFQKNQSTENLEELGIEKVFLLTTVKDFWKREKLEQFIIDNNMTVKQVTQLIKILNNKSEIFQLATLFFKELEKFSKPSDPHNPF